MCVAAPASAAVPPPVTLSTSSQPGDYIGNGASYDSSADGDNVRFTQTDNGALVFNVTDAGGAAGQDWFVSIAPAFRQTLRAGVFYSAERSPNYDSPRAGLDISFAGRGCGYTTGAFYVSEYELDSAGRVTRLRIFFRQHCENQPGVLTGEVSVAATPNDGIGAKYSRLGSFHSFLGLPVAAAQAIVGGRQQQYEHGRILSAATTGAHEVHGAILREYLATAGTLRTGLPTTDELPTAGRTGRYNHFQGGSVFYSRATGAHTVPTAFERVWASRGAERGCLGYPTSNPRSISGGQQQTFQRGTLTFNNWALKVISSC